MVIAVETEPTPDGAMEDIAEKIYSEIFHLDDKVFEAEKVQEIFDWLKDQTGEFDELVTMWREYDQGDLLDSPDVSE